MIRRDMLELGTKRSTIRELFEFGKQMKAELGDGAVFDFSLGNPSVAPPKSVNSGISHLLESYDATALHGYTSAEGDYAVRTAIAEYISATHGIEAHPENIYMTVGAAAALTSTLGAICGEGENVIVLAPYFPEYRVFIEKCGAEVREVKALDGSFLPDILAIAAACDENTAAIIVNSPNNPTGAVYGEDDIAALSRMLEVKSAEVGHPIYLIADEPYRELVYDGARVPFIPNLYKNTVVCYSFSKSLSIPGERIGYVFVPEAADESYSLFRAICGSARALGYVCAPSLLQRLAAMCLGQCADIEIYNSSRLTLMRALTEYGYEVCPPSGAFYLFVKALVPDAREFSDIAKRFGLLLVPSDDFGIPGYVRLAYCQTPDMILRSLPKFRELAEYCLSAKGDKI